MNDTFLVILLGIVSSTQLHLAKAMERQGIEVFDQIAARLRGTGEQVSGGARKPLIYSVGLILNHTEFVWAILAQPFGPPALFTSMYGMGLVALMAYAAGIMKESLSRLEVAGAMGIVAGTLAIGIDSIRRQEINRFQMEVSATFLVLLAVAVVAIVAMALAFRKGEPNGIGVTFGLSAGALGCLDPFFKGIGQNLGGSSHFLPRTPVGIAVFASSFVAGFLAFALTQVGFARKARAGVLVPAYDCAYVVLPVLLQTVLLPTYHLSWPVGLGLASIVAGTVLMRRGRNA